MKSKKPPVLEQVQQQEVTTDKKIFRTSYIKNYFTCPHKYLLSTQYELEQSDAMREGLLFEGYVFDKFKDNNEKELIGRKKEQTINDIKEKADMVRPAFVGGEAFRKLEYDNGKYILQGEADFIGTILYKNAGLEAIADLKFTGDISIWNEANFEQFMQAVTYPYLYFKETGKILPFVYFIIESKYKDPLIKVIKVNVTEDDFALLEEKLNAIFLDDFYPANPNYGTCIQGKWGRCNYLEHCPAGREFIAQSVELNFSDIKEVQEF